MNDLISINKMNKEEITNIVNKAIYLKKLGEKKVHNKLKGLVAANLFFEPSTRTRLSFEAAVLLSGGQYIDLGSVKNSSITKGEDFYDTIRMIEGYSHIIIIRHSDAGAAQLAADIADIPVINAGDGDNEHPTQALQDIMTIYENFDDISALSIGITGDLLYGRAVHSFVYALIKIGVRRLYFVARDGLEIPQYIKKLLKEYKVNYIECDNLKSIVKYIDILYVSRIQRERFSDIEKYKAAIEDYQISPDILVNNPNLKIMHPFPRVNEISREMDYTTNALYFQQAKNGIYVRQIILEYLYKGDELLC